MVIECLPEDLQPYEMQLGQMVREALVRYCRDFKVVRVTTSTIRGERNNIHDCMRAVAKTVFPDYTDAGLKFEIHIGRYRARCKKFNVRLETSNYHTQTVFRFEQQIMNTLFDDMELVNLYVGYVPHPINLVDSTIWVVQPGPGGWCYQLRADAGTMSVTIPPATDPNAMAPKTRVVPKPGKIRKVAKNEE